MEGAPVSSLVSKLHVDAEVLIKIYACIINQTPEFCKGLLDGRGIKGEGENNATALSTSLRT